MIVRVPLCSAACTAPGMELGRVLLLQGSYYLPTYVLSPLVGKNGASCCSLESVKFESTKVSYQHPENLDQGQR